MDMDLFSSESEELVLFFFLGGGKTSPLYHFVGLLLTLDVTISIYHVERIMGVQLDLCLTGASQHQILKEYCI